MDSSRLSRLASVDNGQGDGAHNMRLTEGSYSMGSGRSTDISDRLSGRLTEGKREPSTGTASNQCTYSMAVMNPCAYSMAVMNPCTYSIAVWQ
jgi:hypothetical protein